MEITLLSQNALRIKGKKSILLVDVLDTQKTEANAYLYLQQDVLQVKKDKNALFISGPGEYEVSGTKIAAFRNNDDILYQLTIDGMKVFLASSDAFVRMKDKVDEQNIVLLFTNELIDQSALTNAQPTVVVCYGDKALEVSKNLGKGLNKKEGEAETNPDATIKSVDKFVMSVEKLPAELQVVLLG
ncbi:MAG: hypothetical protein KBD46_00895 [Candidatus Levybacteria bacterium]|nr:hypothetical protein [Candidatus Levybacteria bacterium]